MDGRVRTAWLGFSANCEAERNGKEVWREKKVGNRKSSKPADGVRRTSCRAAAAPEVRRMEGGAKTAETTTLTPFVYCS